jgi:hypothetical protein
MRTLVLASAAIIVSGQSYVRSYQPSGAYFGHETGYIFQTTEWQTGVTQPTKVYMTYGPYATDAPPTVPLTVAFTLQVDNNSADNNVLVVLDVHDADTNAVYASLNVTREDFLLPNANQQFSLQFSVPAGPSKLEYRVFYVGWALVTHVLTTVSGGNPPSPSPSPVPPPAPLASAYLYDLRYVTGMPTLQVISSPSTRWDWQALCCICRTPCAFCSCRLATKRSTL